MKEMRTLYVSNLSNEVSEQLLVRIFTVYGDIEFVKIVRHERNWAFIQFFQYPCAYNAKSGL